jgi:hypothetical protein
LPFQNLHKRLGKVAICRSGHGHVRAVFEIANTKCPQHERHCCSEALARHFPVVPKSTEARGQQRIHICVDVDRGLQENEEGKGQFLVGLKCRVFMFEFLADPGERERAGPGDEILPTEPLGREAEAPDADPSGAAAGPRNNKRNKSQSAFDVGTTVCFSAAGVARSIYRQPHQPGAPQKTGSREAARPAPAAEGSRPGANIQRAQSERVGQSLLAEVPDRTKRHLQLPQALSGGVDQAVQPELESLAADTVESVLQPEPVRERSGAESVQQPVHVGPELDAEQCQYDEADGLESVQGGASRRDEQECAVQEEERAVVYFTDGVGDGVAQVVQRVGTDGQGGELQEKFAANYHFGGASHHHHESQDDRSDQSLWHEPAASVG